MRALYVLNIDRDWECGGRWDRRKCVREDFRRELSIRDRGNSTIGTLKSQIYWPFLLKRLKNAGLGRSFLCLTQCAAITCRNLVVVTSLSHRRLCALWIYGAAAEWQHKATFRTHFTSSCRTKAISKVWIFFSVSKVLCFAMRAHACLSSLVHG